VPAEDGGSAAGARAGSDRIDAGRLRLEPALNVADQAIGTRALDARRERREDRQTLS
jgi:hypothetical protein